MTPDEMHEALRGHLPVPVMPSGLTIQVRCRCNLNDDRPYNWHIVDVLKGAQ